MIKIEDIQSAEDLAAYIDSILNDFEAGITDKEEAAKLFRDLIISVIEKLPKK